MSHGHEKAENQKENPQIDVVLLFLAHDGINNIDIWKRWFQEDSSVDCLIYMPRPSDDIFIKQHLASREILAMPTKWGHKSLVLVFQAMLRESLVKFANATTFYLVSGTHIPICSASKIERGKTIITYAVTKELLFRKGKFEISENYAASPIDIPTKLRVRPQFHEQWVALKRPHATCISEFDFTQFDPIDIEVQSQEDINPKPAPDEYYILLALRLSGIKKQKSEIVSEATCASIFRREEDVSPYTFLSLHDKECDMNYIDESGKPCITSKFSLQAYIDAMHKWRPKVAFLRKCASIYFEDRNPWNRSTAPMKSQKSPKSRKKEPPQMSRILV